MARLWKRSPRRTLLLGLFALGVLLWGTVSQFDIPGEVVLDSLLAMLLVLAAIMLLAGLAVVAWVNLRRLLASRGGLREHRSDAREERSGSPERPEEP